MFRAGQDLFVHLGGAGHQRVLHPIRVCEVEDDVSFVVFQDQSQGVGSIEPDQAVVLFFQGPKEFMQQPAQIVGMRQEESGLWLGIRTTGDPASAESRQCFRVCTVLGSYITSIDNETGCRIADVSATGFGVFAKGDYAFGDVVDVSFELEGCSYSGRACVQSLKQVAAGFRYGLLNVDGDGEGNLADGLQRLTMHAQRTQLKRISGAA